VLIATIAGGCLFGTVGLVLAAPLLSAAVRIVADVSAAEEKEAQATQPPAASGPAEPATT
jgi:predicted PurR-regulated permease PerM